MSTTMPELYDQTGYIIRIGVGGAILVGDKCVRAKDISVVVNDDYWKGVKYFDAKARDIEGFELGSPNSFLMPGGAFGSIEIRPLRKDVDAGDPIIEPARRIMTLDPDSVVAVVICDPDDGSELRRITFHGCRWDPPGVHTVEGGSKLNVVAGFRAEWYEDR